MQFADDDGGSGLALLNDWQRSFPCVERPFAAVAAASGSSEQVVLESYRRWLAAGVISRIGGVWNAGAGGAAMLCAFAVPPQRLEDVAAAVSAEPGVNHNYEREHGFNLWFVVTGRDRASIDATLARLERACALEALRLPMRRAYRIDLGFDLRERLAPAGSAARTVTPAVQQDDLALAACLEDGLPLTERPFDEWAHRCGRSTAEVLATLRCWLSSGTLRRFGVIVRHHEAGFAHNAMTVFDVPDGVVDACGAKLAAQDGVTLAYCRERAPLWRFNLYCMVHGRDRGEVMRAIERAIEGAGLNPFEHRVLFSRRRFKQRGGRYFSAPQPQPAYCHAG